MAIAPAQAARVARALWIAWAVIVWNVVFDQVIVRAGQRLIDEAGRAAIGINLDDFMRPAVTRGLWLATLAASAILLVGLSSIRLTTRPPGR
jgi:predicted secreted protein